jgi:hypothetical protein
MASANPFHGIFETDTYIHARTLRTDFWQKIWDTFYVFAGWMYYPERKKKKDHVGIFDYATLMIPHLIDRLTIWCWTYKGNHPAAIALFGFCVIPATIISIVTNIVRFASAAVFTLLMSPIVGIVNGISRVWGYLLYKTALALPIDEPTLYFREYPLGQYLQRYGEELENFSIHAEGTYKKIKLTLNRRKYDGLNYSGCNGCENHWPDHHHVYGIANLDLEKKEDRERFDALLRLNIGGLTRKLEKAGVQFGLFNLAHSAQSSAGVSDLRQNQTVDTKHRKRS